MLRQLRSVAGWLALWAVAGVSLWLALLAGRLLSEP